MRKYREKIEIATGIITIKTLIPYKNCLAFLLGDINSGSFICIIPIINERYIKKINMSYDQSVPVIPVFSGPQHFSWF